MCLETTQITLLLQLQYFFVACFASNCSFWRLLPIFDNITKICFGVSLLKNTCNIKCVLHGKYSGNTVNYAKAILSF